MSTTTKSLEMKIHQLLEQTIKARLYAAVVSLAETYSDVTKTPEVIRPAITLHTRLMNAVRAPYISRHSLQDCGEIEVDYPVDIDMDIAWILESETTLQEFVNTRMVKRLNPNRFNQGT